MANTVNYNWVKPTVGGDIGTWGAELNTELDGIDTTVKAVSDVANAALPLAGGTMTGELSIVCATYREVSMLNQSGAVSIDLSQGVGFSLTFNGSTTFSFTNIPHIRDFTTFWMRLVNGGTVSITFPAGVKWTNGTTPTFSISGIDVIEFVTFNASAGSPTWYGRALVTGATA